MSEEVSFRLSGTASGVKLIYPLRERVTCGLCGESFLPPVELSYSHRDSASSVKVAGYADRKLSLPEGEGLISATTLAQRVFLDNGHLYQNFSMNWGTTVLIGFQLPTLRGFYSWERPTGTAMFFLAPDASGLTNLNELYYTKKMERVYMLAQGTTLPACQSCPLPSSYYHIPTKSSSLRPLPLGEYLFTMLRAFLPPLGAQMTAFSLQLGALELMKRPARSIWLPDPQPKIVDIVQR